MGICVFLDESGDLGWSLDLPYRNHGSSRYLSIAHVFVDSANVHLLGRFVRSLYKKRKLHKKHELKATMLTADEKMLVANQTVDFIGRGIISIHARTVFKPNVDMHIRDNENVIYNYLVKRCILSEIEKYPEVTLYPDKRSIKVQYANSLGIYLQTALFEKGSGTKVNYNPVESSSCLPVQYADYLANIVWNRYEDNDAGPYNIIYSHIKHRVEFLRRKK